MVEVLACLFHEAVDVDDDTGNPACADKAGRVVGGNREGEPFSLDLFEYGLRGHLGAWFQGCEVVELDPYPDARLGLVEDSVEGAARRLLAERNQSRGGKHRH